MKRIIILCLILIISVIFFIKGRIHSIDEYGTREVDLVKAAGSNVCMSCIGLSDENLIEKIFKAGPDELKKEEK